MRRTTVAAPIDRNGEILNIQSPQHCRPFRVSHVTDNGNIAWDIHEQCGCLLAAEKAKGSEQARCTTLVRFAVTEASHLRQDVLVQRMSSKLNFDHKPVG